MTFPGSETHADDRRIVDDLDAARRLVGGEAHDLNNALFVILGHARLMAEGATSDAAREDAEAIVAAAQQATAVTARMMAFSHGDAGSFDGATRPGDAPEPG